MSSRKSLEARAAELKALSKIIEGWSEDCPNKPSLVRALVQGDLGILSGSGNGIATLSSSLGTVQLYHVQKPREVLPVKLGESEISGKHGDDFQYGGDKSNRLDLIGFIDSQSEYDAIKTTLVTMRQGQGANAIAVTVRFGASAYINAVNHWVGEVEIDPEAGTSLFMAEYKIPCIKRD